MNDKEQEEIRQRLLGCIESGNFGMATPEQQAETGDYIDLDLIASLHGGKDEEYEVDEIVSALYEDEPHPYHPRSKKELQVAIEELASRGLLGAITPTDAHVDAVWKELEQSKEDDQ